VNVPEVVRSVFFPFLTATLTVAGLETQKRTVDSSPALTVLVETARRGGFAVSSAKRFSAEQ
jgi:hypothetical protein